MALCAEAGLDMTLGKRGGVGFWVCRAAVDSLVLQLTSMPENFKYPVFLFTPRAKIVPGPDWL